MYRSKFPRTTLVNLADRRKLQMAPIWRSQLAVDCKMLHLMNDIPRGSIYTTIMELDPQSHDRNGLLGPNSILVVYMDPLGKYLNNASGCTCAQDSNNFQFYLLNCGCHQHHDCPARGHRHCRRHETRSHSKYTTTRNEYKTDNSNHYKNSVRHPVKLVVAAFPRRWLPYHSQLH